MELEYYVLRRNDDYQIVSVLCGNNPLYSNGSWDILSGPFATYNDAEKSIELIVLMEE